MRAVKAQLQGKALDLQAFVNTCLFYMNCGRART